MAIFSFLRFRVKAVYPYGGGTQGLRQVPQRTSREPVGSGCYILKRRVRRI